MKKIKRLASILTLSALILISCFSGVYVAGAVDAADEEPDYYVALSSQNYAIKNANKMTKSEDGNYYLNKISLSSAIQFYVTDNAGVRYYSFRGEEMTVEETFTCDYNIKFSPSLTFDEEEDGYAATKCHITYAFYTPAEYEIQIVKGAEQTSVSLSYNPYFTDYELYYISSLYVESGSTIRFGEESHSVSNSGYYRILFTPITERDGSIYAFNADGEYGSGDDYRYCLYVEDAPMYYAAFKSGVKKVSDKILPIDINGKPSYPLVRYEKNIYGEEYRLIDFFVSERDTSVKFYIYELEPTGNYRLIDSDNDEETEVSKIKTDDAGWYELSFTVNTDEYAVNAVWSERSLEGFYIVGDFNGYGFDSDGGVDIDEKFAFIPVEEEDEEYSEEYRQYILYLTLTEKDVKQNNVEFYISDGKNKYKNGTDYISLNVAGKYKILFSEEHVYSQGRYYRYTLIDEEKDGEVIEISTVQEFNDFAKKCSESADYSMNLSVYLICDLDFASEEFTPVKSFSGKFYGGYHSLKNITISGDDTAAFVFLTRFARVERLTVENLTIDAKNSNYVAFIGKNYGTVQRVTVSGSITGDNYVGGVVAYNGISRIDENSATIDSNDVVQKGRCENCKNEALITGKSNVGGIVGFNSGEVISCVNNGNVVPYTQTKATLTNFGGIVGFSAGKVADCVNNGEIGIKSYAFYVGGVIGFGTGDNYFCANNGNIYGLKYVGGVMGGYGNVTQDNNDQKDYFGGLDYEAIINEYFSGGESQDEIVTGAKHGQEYLQNYGAVTAGSYVAGVLGNSDYTELIIRNSLSTGNINSVSGGYVGGILGNGSITVRGCFSFGTIQADGATADYVGGIAGNVGKAEYCMSAATVIGGDYAGGIAGYVRDIISSCYTNCSVISDSKNENVGLIAGDESTYNQSLHSFSDEFKYNYYIGNLGGIGRTEYAEQFNYAAASITSEKLLSEGGLSMYLNEFFNHEYWQGGEKNSYPVLTYMLETFDLDDIDDEEELFARHLEKLKSVMYDTAKIAYTVTFMEWNKDNGDLYDEEKLQYQNFDVIDTVRVEKGASVENIALKYATLNGGVWIYEGTDRVYSVTLSMPENVQDNIVIYAVYTEMISTISTPDGQVLIEGLFDARTQVHVMQTGEYVKFEFELDGQKIDINSFQVKYRKPSADATYEVYSAADELNLIHSTEYGNYLCFDGNDGYFKIVEIQIEDDFSVLEISLMASTSALFAICVVIVTVILVKRRRAKKRQKKNRNA